MTDLRYALRRLAATPGFTLVVLLTLGLGLGGNAAIFSAVHRLILEPMPFHDGDRLAFVWREAVDGGMLATPAPEVAHAWLQADEAVDGTAIWRSGHATLLDGGNPLRVGVYAITPGLPTLLGIRPSLGRVFTEEEAQTGAPVALVSEGLWRGRLGGDADILGKPIRFDIATYTVIGVVPDRFGGFDGRDGDDEVWTPLARGDLVGMSGRVGALVRIREGASLEQASAELHGLARAAAGDTDDSRWRYRAVAPEEFLGSDTRAGLFVLLGAVTVVLLIACANIAALLLIRLAGRRSDLALRMALGASRSRLLRALSVELAVLAALGAGAGLFFAHWFIAGIQAMGPPQIQGISALALDRTVVVYALVVASGTLLLFGIGPALTLLRRDTGSPFRSALGQGSRVVQGSRARAVLVVGQIALSVVLLIAAGLLVRTVANLGATDLGFRPDGLVTVKLELPTERYPDDAIGPFVQRALEQMAAVPGVVATVDAVAAPPDMGITYGVLEIEGRSLPEGARGKIMPAGFVGPGFFGVLGADLVAGRDLAPEDIDGNGVVVDQTFARQHWPDLDPVGRRFRVGEAEWNTVVGVVDDLAVHGPGRAATGAIFYTNDQSFRRLSFVIRAATADAASLGPALRAALAEVDPLLAPEAIEAVVGRIDRSVARQRFFMALMITFAGLAVLLATLGLYGLMAFAVSRRIREIGIRLALGAATSDVRDLLLRNGAALTTVGIVLGLAAAWVAARTLESLLYQVDPRDPVTFAGAAILIALTALAACWLPVRTAMRVDPMVTLRME